MIDPAEQFVSRAGAKLAAALEAFAVSVHGRTCADLGANVGGFVDCLLRRGAARVYAVERGYGVLHARLRADPRVVVLERTNALTLTLPAPVDLVTIDAGWTRQRLILAAARRLLAPDECIISLVKPHYEAGRDRLRRGVLPPDAIGGVLAPLRAELPALQLTLLAECESPLPGRAGNREFLWLLARAGAARRPTTARAPGRACG